MSIKVLLVDDETNVTEGLKRNLRKEPLDIFTASSGRQALRILGEETIDIVVSDERMPEMSGAEFVARVQRDYPSTVRIMLSGQADLQAVVKAVNEGEIYRFLFKPCRAEELIATIHQAAKHKELLDRSAWLLREYKKQAEVIDQYENGGDRVSEVERDEDGAVMLKEESMTLDEILSEMRSEMGG